MIETASGRVSVPVPTYRMPDVAKRSAGYHAAPGMDLIDLFIGSEGTLGVITEITFRTLSPAPNIVLAWIPCADEAQGLALVEASARRVDRDAADRRGGRTSTPAPSSTWTAARSRSSGRTAPNTRHNVSIPDGTALALLVQLELNAETDAAQAFEQIQACARTATPGNSPLGHFCRLLDAPESSRTPSWRCRTTDGARRISSPFAKPCRPGSTSASAPPSERIDARIEKTAGDMVVPFERFGEMMAIYRHGFESRGLDYAIWGHLSDGNVHPNVIPRSYDDVVKGKDAMLEFGRHVARLGGCPLAEHGVGTQPGQTGAAAAALRRCRHRRDARRQTRARPWESPRAGSNLPAPADVGP